MRIYLILSIFILSLIFVGCANKPMRVDEFDPAPDGKLRFEGVSEENCASEQGARNEARMDAMAQAGRYVFTYIDSVTRSSAKEERDNLKIDIKTAFESMERGISHALLKGLKVEDESAWENPDGTYKARVIVLADTAQLMKDMKELQGEVKTSAGNGERAVRVLKSQVRQKMQKAKPASLPPQRLELLAEALVPYKELQAAQASIQDGRQAAAMRDWLQALAYYEKTPIITRDAPPDDSPVPDVDHAYRQNWELLRDAANMLKDANEHKEVGELVSAQKLLDEFYQRMGDASGPFTHAETGEALPLSPLPPLLAGQLDDLRQRWHEAFQRGEAAAAAGDILGAITAWHEARVLNREDPQAQQRLDQAIRMYATANLEVKPVELEITSRVATEKHLRVYLKTSDGRSLPMPIAFGFQESGVDAEMITDLLDGVSSQGTLTIKKIRQSPSNTNQLLLLASPSPESLGSLNKTIIIRLQSALENHIISIPITLKPAKLAIMLSLSSKGMSQERVSQFQKDLADMLHQNEYHVVETADINTMKVRGNLRMRSAPISSVVSLNLAITLSFWHNSSALAEGVQLSSGAVVDQSEEAALANAHEIVIQKCAVEIERQMKQALGE